MQLQGQHVLILGLGLSGLAMARWCARAGARVTVADTRAEPPQWAQLHAEWPDVALVSGPMTAELVEGTAIRAVFRSPGLSPDAVAPVVQAAQAMGLWQGGELSLFAAALKDLQATCGYRPQVLAITGTNGKTTVTSLTGQLVARAGKTVQVAGQYWPHFAGHPDPGNRAGAGAGASASRARSTSMGGGPARGLGAGAVQFSARQQRGL